MKITFYPKLVGPMNAVLPTRKVARKKNTIANTNAVDMEGIMTGTGGGGPNALVG